MTPEWMNAAARCEITATIGATTVRCGNNAAHEGDCWFLPARPVAADGGASAGAGTICHADVREGMAGKGCGRPIPPGEEYRCLDCDAVMHQDCLRWHCSADEKDRAIWDHEGHIATLTAQLDRVCVDADAREKALEAALSAARAQAAEATAERDRLRHALQDAIASVTHARKTSVGSFGSHYLPLIDVARVDRWRAALSPASPPPGSGATGGEEPTNG
jgi:hypothetical protein